MQLYVLFCGITHRSTGFTVTDIEKPSGTLLSIMCRSVIPQNAKQLAKQQGKGCAAVVLVMDGGSGAPNLPSTCTTVMHGMHKGFQSSWKALWSFLFFSLQWCLQSGMHKGSCSLFIQNGTLLMEIALLAPLIPEN